MQGSVGYLIWTICYLSVLFGSLGLRHSSLLHHLSLPEEPEAGDGSDVPLRAAAEGDDAAADFQRGLRGGAVVASRSASSIIRGSSRRSRCWTIRPMTPATLTASVPKNCGSRGFNVEADPPGRPDRVQSGRARRRPGGCRRRLRLHPGRGFRSAAGPAQATIHFFTDPKVGMIQTRWGHLNRGYSLLTRVQAMFLDGHLLLEQTARSRSGRFFNFNGTAGLWRTVLHRGSRRLAARHADRRSRSQLPGAARGLEVHLPAERGHAGGTAGGHERLQVAAASLDERLDPDLQETAAHHLAQQAALAAQTGGHGAFNLQLRIPPACLFMCAAPSLHGRAADGLAADVPRRRPDLPHRVAFGRRLLYLRAARAASPHLDEGDSSFALPCSRSASDFP